MGSSQRYWQYARDCARWAGEAKQEDDRELLQRLAKAWINVALVEGDVTRQAVSEVGSKRQLQ